MTDFDAEIFSDPRTRVVLLGTLLSFDGVHALIAGSGPNAIRLDDEQFQILSALNIEEQGALFSQYSQALLLSLADSGYITFVRGTDDLTFTVKARVPLTWDRETDNGYRIAGGSTFVELSPVGCHLLSGLAEHPEGTLAEVVAAVKSKLLDDPEDAAVIADTEAELGQNVDEILFEETIEFIHTLTTSGLAIAEAVTGVR